MAQAPKYTPNPVPANPEDLPRYIFEELIKLQGALEENATTFIEVKNVEPERIKQGELNSQRLYTEPEGLNINGELPVVPKNSFKKGVYY